MLTFTRQSVLLAVVLFVPAMFVSAAVAPKKPILPLHGQSGQTPACSGGARLSGWYGFLVGGTAQTGGGWKTLSGALNLDGNCNLSGANISGGLNGSYGSTSASGTYNQNADGTYTLTLNLAGDPTQQTYVVGTSESGTRARGMETDGTAVATITLQSQFTTLTAGYSTASLSGTYAASCWGANYGVDLNSVTFDGNGNLFGQDPYDNDGNSGNLPYTGNYTVNGDGTFSGTLNGAFSIFTFNGVIDAGVTEIQYGYQRSGVGSVVVCSGRQFTANNLSGWYGLVVGGSAANNRGGKYLTGAMYFDGNGNLSAANVNGGINGAVVNTSVSGTYTANSDGSISLVMKLAGDSTTQMYVVGVSESGNKAVGIETDGTAMATIDLQGQLPPASAYTTASLVGTYAASCFGSAVGFDWIAFDGNGNFAGVGDSNNGSVQVSQTYTGTYTVNADGTFSGGRTDGSYTLTGVMDNTTAEIGYTYAQPGVGGVTACTGESSYEPVGQTAVAPTPTFSPAPGAYSSSQWVSLSDALSGTVLHYTTNGSAPTASSPVYSAPIAVNATTTVQVIAVASGYGNSALTAGTYFYAAGGQTANAPQMSPVPGVYYTPLSVTLSDTTPGALIYYTTDGSTPSTASNLYSVPIQVGASETLQAIAVAAGYGNSATASGTYTIPISMTVSLGSYYNIYGIGTAGAKPIGGGLDNKSYAYNASLLGASLSYQGLSFPLGAANALDAVNAVTIPASGSLYNQLYLVGAGVGSQNQNQHVVVTYTDGTTSSFKQSFSNWVTPKNYPGETLVAQFANRIGPNGKVYATKNNVYGYTFNLTPGKTPASVTLPAGRSVVFLGVGWGSKGN